MWSICKKELRQFFGSLVGYMAIILFLLINGLFLFIFNDSNLFDFGYASLANFFELSPWILMFLIPAVTMRTFADEFKSGTFEILKTRPLTQWQIVLGKYIAVLLILFLAIIPTLVYVFTIKELSLQGNIDVGGILGSYIGLLFLTATFAAIGLCCSGFTNNAIVAFLLSAFACLLLYFGFSTISKMQIFTSNADYYIEMLGIDFHYQSISRGVIDSRDIIYYLSAIVFFLCVAEKNLQNKHI